MAKQLHWTQTPEGKIRMAEVQKKVWAAKRVKKAMNDARKAQFAELSKDIVKAAYKPNGKAAHGGWRYCPHCGEPLK